MKVKKLYLNIDIVRFLATILVIANHTSPFLKLNKNFDFFITRVLARITVPLFFMISGYFCLTKDKNHIKSYTNKILKIYFFCIILYIPVNIYTKKYLPFNLIYIIRDIFINGTFYHLWYFPALILGLWVTYYLIKKLGDKKAFIITLILYIIGLLGDSYYGITASSEILKNIYNIIFKISDYTRNGLFFAPIFLFLGYFSKPNKNNLLYSLIFFIFMILEAFILNNLNCQRHDSMYIFLIPTMYFLFSYLIYNKKTNKQIRNIATKIYIFHPLFIILIRFIGNLFNIKFIIINNNLILFIIVTILTTIFSILLEIKKNNSICI